ncbi:hypothetical protein ACFL7D_11835, partial [candidate division KSB1 bacterium]
AILKGYISGFEICPHNSNTLYVGSMGSLFDSNAEKSEDMKGVFKSNDSGKNWEDISSKDLSNIQALAVSEKDPDVIFASPGG